MHKGKGKGGGEVMTATNMCSNFGGFRSCPPLYTEYVDFLGCNLCTEYVDFLGCNLCTEYVDFLGCNLCTEYVDFLGCNLCTEYVDFGYKLQWLK